MAKTTVIFGLLLIGLGVIGYVGDKPAEAATTPNDSTAASVDEAADTDKPAGKSMTALIPAVFGALLVVCGLIAFSEPARKHAMHAASMVALLGVLAGGGRGVSLIGKFLSGEANQRSFLFVWIMAILCGIFLYLCIQSFIAARKRREATAQA